MVAEPPADTDQIAAADTYPRLAARTMRFTLGQPRSFAVSPDGERVAFLRTSSGTDRAHALWLLDVGAGAERMVADPVALLAGSSEELTEVERARRERLREGSAGIVAYSTDAAVRTAVFTLSGRLYVVGLDDPAAEPTELTVAGSVIDPRLDPTGVRVAYCAGGALRVTNVHGSDDRSLIEPAHRDETWGLADFIASEELERFRGFWWAPDGTSLLAAHVDERRVQVWHVTDAARPEAPPRPIRYPAAGTGNAAVHLAHLGLDGTRLDVGWDHDAYEYLVSVSWNRHGPPLLTVLSRDQRRSRVLEIDVASGATQVRHEASEADWLDVVPGVPRWLPGGRLLTTLDDATAGVCGTRRLVIDDVAVTPPDLQIRSVLDSDETGVLVTASTEPTETHLMRVSPEGEVVTLTELPGVHSGRAGGGTVVRVRSALDADGPEVEVTTTKGSVLPIRSVGERPPFRPAVRMLRLGDREIRAALVLPHDHEPGSSKLPVLMDPYGGPHAQRVVSASRAYHEAQWLANQGFAVIVADGRGTPGRGVAWERAVRNDFAGVTLTDQVEALDAAARQCADLDLDRVGIRGWSYGGYLAALAVLRRPDVFHAAVAGAPVTEWRLYDTAYTERYLGDPREQPEVYDANSLLVEVERMPTDRARRPLMIIHGLADDNVVAAHTLRLSSALLAVGYPHTVLPLSGVTHMTPQEVVAENLLRLQVDFLRTALG